MILNLYAMEQQALRRIPSQRTYMKKEKFRKQDKTQHHKCSQCIRKDAIKVKVSAKEVRWLCPVCIKRNNNRDEIEKPNFIKASVLQTS